MSRHLPVVTEPAPAEDPAPRPRRRHPRWLRVPMPAGEGYRDLRARVRELLSEEQPAGAHALVWDGTDDAGRAVASPDGTAEPRDRAAASD